MITILREATKLSGIETYRIYTVSKKKVSVILPITVPNVDGFSKLISLADKVKEYHTHEECWWGAYLPYLGNETVSG